MSLLSGDSIKDYKTILDNLPYIVTIQDLNYTIIYENKKSVELFGTRLHAKCWEIWADLPGLGKGVCEDCMLSIVQLDRTEHTIFRTVVSNEGDEKLLKIVHVPLFDKKGNMTHIIEIIEDITDYTYNPRELRTLQNMLENIRYAFVKLGEKGSEVVTTDKLHSMNINNETFFLEKLTVYLITAVIQGYHVNDGLYGPLPVLDKPNHLAFVYPFSIKDPQVIDPRKQGIETVLLFIFIHRSASFLFRKLPAIEKYVKELVSEFAELQEIDSQTHKKFAKKMTDFLEKINRDELN